MIRIETVSDTASIPDDFVRSYTRKLLETFLKEYPQFCANGSIQTIGAIFILESGEELKQYRALGLPCPIYAFEWLDEIGNRYQNGCVVIDNDRSVNIIGKQEYFDTYLEEINNERNN